jgi:hypothetical protein
MYAHEAADVFAGKARETNPFPNNFDLMTNQPPDPITGGNCSASKLVQQSFGILVSPIYRDTDGWPAATYR